MNCPVQIINVHVIARKNISKKDNEMEQGNANFVVYSSIF